MNVRIVGKTVLRVKTTGVTVIVVSALTTELMARNALALMVKSIPAMDARNLSNKAAKVMSTLTSMVIANLAVITVLLVKMTGVVATCVPTQAIL